VRVIRYRRRIVMLALVAVLCGATIACESFAVHRAQRARAALGDRLYVEAAGSGSRVIVFLPGLLGSTHYWRAAGLTPRDGTQFLYIDLLGFGRSPWPDRGYTLDDHVMALRRTLLHEGAVRNVTIVAHSFGALVATEYASRFPEEVDHLILFGSPVYRSSEEARRDVGGMSWLAGLTVQGRPLARIVCALHNAIGPISALIAARFRPDLPSDVARDGALHFWPSLDGTIRDAILCHPITESLRRTRANITFVHGARDQVAPMERVRLVANEYHARLIETDDTHGTYYRSAPPLLIEIVGGDAIRLSARRETVAGRMSRSRRDRSSSGN